MCRPTRLRHASWLVPLALGAALTLTASSAVAATRRPVVQTGRADAITATAATLHASVNTRGLAAVYRFDYGASITYTKHTPWTAVRSTTSLQVQAAVGQLTASSHYHYRIVATTCSSPDSLCLFGTSYGADASFTTTSGYQNPVYAAAPAPDPYVLDDGGAHRDYWEFNTGDLFPLLHSTDLVHWADGGTAMTTRPPWVVASGDWHPWAPSVVQTGSSCPGSTSGSCYLMYYVGRSAQYGFNCVAVATSTTPGGPYTDRGPLARADGAADSAGRPIGCGDQTGYANIDPSPLAAADGRYLYLSTDNTCPAGSGACTSANGTPRPTISVIPLSPDGLSASGPRTALFSGDPGTWEAAGAAVPTVENPTALEHGGTYYVLYSGGDWQGAYGMGYATASSPGGPFTKGAENPILSETTAVLSPGGGDTPVTGPSGGAWLIYHGRDGSYANPRTLRIDPFSWTAGPAGTPDVPVIAGPTSPPQPATP